MDWMRGLRAAVALCVPLVAGDVLGLANFGWMGLGGYEGTISDPGGPYRLRMRSLLTLTVGGGVGVFLGEMAGNSLHWALPLTMLWCFAWSYVAVLGQPFTTAGVLVQVVYICGLGAPAANWRTALGPALLLMAGGAWSMALSLFLWPLDSYRPARSAVADCYAELASFLQSVMELSARPGQKPELWHRLAQHHQFRIRSVVERAWNAVAHARTESLGGSPQEQQLVVLLETADLLIARTIAVAEYLEAESVKADSTGCDERALSGLEQLRLAEEWIAATLVRKRRETSASVEMHRQRLHDLPLVVENCGAADSPTRFLQGQIRQAASLLEAAVESTGVLRLGALGANELSLPGVSGAYFGPVYARMGELRRGWNFDLLAANLNGKSLILRHAARVSLVCGLDVAIMLIAHVNHGYWLMMTSLIVLQPHVAGTLRRGMQRIGGTVAGGVVAAVLALQLHSQSAMAAVLFVFSLLSLAFLPVSYAIFAFFLTPTFVLAWMPYAGDWQLAILRIANTLAGALIAVAATLYLFPAYERERTPQFLHASLEANRRYLAELAGAWRAGQRSSRTLANARRATGLAHNDSEESLDRLLAESWSGAKNAGRFAAIFVTYLRRLAQSITTLTALEGELHWKSSAAVQERLRQLDIRLKWLIAQVMGEEGGPDWPGAVEAAPADTAQGERFLERLERQVDVLGRQLVALQEHGWLRQGRGAGKHGP
jgi:uncharacterized membrane protein YccC